MNVAYMYAVLDRNASELLAFHWQPGPEFAGPDLPHLHVSASLRLPRGDGSTEALPLDKIHVPTGLITPAAVVRMLIVEFDVEPIVADWAARLDRGEALLGNDAE